MTTVEALKWANEKLKIGGQEVSDSPMLDAQILLAAILKVSTSWLFTHFDKELKESQLEEFRRVIKRRIDKEPIAYITGEKEFFKRSFLVNPLVLIPRPATETLVEAAIKIAAAESGSVLFADIGTGSGAIAVTLAAETGLPVIASDVSPSALTVARKNSELNKTTELVDFRQGDLLEPLKKIFEAIKKNESQKIYDHLILCANLPYLTSSQWKETPPDVYLYEPKLALEAGQDGLDLYWRLIRELKKNRRLFPARLSILWEIDPDQKNSAVTLIKREFPDTEIIILTDLEKFERVVVAEI